MAVRNAKPLEGQDAVLRRFDSVRLVEDLTDTVGVMFLDEQLRPSSIAAGARGAIVDICDDGVGRWLYEVELTEPVAALVSVRRDQIARV